MNREEQQRALEGILESLGRARLELDDAVSSAHRLRDGADEGSPLSFEDLDYDICVALEELCDDVRMATKTVEGMLDELDEDEDEEEAE